MLEIISETGDFTFLYYFPNVLVNFNERTKDGYYSFTTFETENVTIEQIENMLNDYFHAGFVSDFTDRYLKLKIILNDGDL